MPDSYSNPSYKPPTRPYTWVPNTVPTGGDTPIGFYPTHIVRGSFRNDVPVQEGYSGGSVTITVAGEQISSKGSENNPILVVHRPMADPDNDRGAPPDEKFKVKGADFKWQAELSSSARLSCVTLEYALVVDVNDPALLNFLDDADKAALQDYLSNPSGEPPSIDWSKYKFAKITLDDVEYPKPNTDGTFKALQVTGTTESLNTIDVKFVQSFVSNDFPVGKKLAISNRVGLASLKLVLSKVFIFEAERVNLHADQLPCALMEYAYPVRFAFNPTQIMDAQRLPFPSDANNPNFHVKVFSPEERIAKQYGLAHSINLRFLVFSMPIFDPLGIFNLYFAVFIGPVPGRRTVKTSLSGQLATAFVANANRNRVVVTDSVTIEKDAQTLRIEKIDSATSIPPPSNNANWVRIDESEYNIAGSNVFDSEGPYVSEYLFLDDSTSEHNWYRIVQSLSSSGEKVSSPIKNQTYSERVMYRALSSASTSTKKDTIVRRVPLSSDFINGDPLNAQRPVATFVMDGFNALSNPISFRKGAFRLAFSTKVSDAEFLLNTHLFARFWFVPDSASTDINNLYQWRDSTEFHFESTSAGNKIVKGKPRSLQDLIVSPPIPGEDTYLEMTRYNDEAVTFNAPFSGGAKLVVALYVAGYPSADGTTKNINKNTINLPKITLNIDAQYGTFETPIQYVQSDVLFAQRADRYNSSQFVELDKPLVVTVNKIGGGVLEGENFPEYKSNFKSNDSEPFSGLLKLEKDSAGELAKFCIPITAVPGERDEQIYVSADFATGDSALDAGRVLDGEWEVAFKVNQGIDFSVVGIDYRIEMFLVSGDGKVTERIFRSSIFKSAEANVSYKPKIEIPMIISGTGTQLVMRLIGYPYSKDGNAVDVGSLQNQLGDVPFGLRIESLQIKSHTVSRLSISQVASFLGSPAFYEQLQLVPNQSIGQTSDFWFIASEFLTHAFVVNGTTGIDITGSLYSPAWFINMPSGMEVRARGQGFKDHDVWFRTVPADAAAGEPALSAVEDKVSKSVHLAHEDTDEVSGQSVGMMSSQSVIKHKTFDSPYRKAVQDNNVAGNNASGVSTLSNTAPNLAFLNSGSFSNKNSGVLGLVTQYEGNDYAAAQMNMNTSVNGYGTWFGANRDLAGKDFATTKKFVDGLQSPAFAQSPVSSLSYVAGWCEPGSILLKEASAWDSRSGGSSEGTIFLVDGLTNEFIPDTSPIVQPSFVSGLKAVQTFPGIVIDSHDNVVVCYTLEGRTGELFARSFVGGQNMSNPYVIATFRSKGELVSEVDIFAPTMYWHHPTESFYVAMWCGGKVFVTTFNGLRTGKGVMMNPLQLVAGDRDFSSGKNTANPVFESLVSNGGLLNNQKGTQENDVPQQRVGLFVSDKWPFQGNVFVYYKDSNNKLMVRQVRIGGITGAQKEIV